MRSLNAAAAKLYSEVAAQMTLIVCHLLSPYAVISEERREFLQSEVSLSDVDVRSAIGLHPEDGHWTLKCNGQKTCFYREPVDAIPLSEVCPFRGSRPNCDLSPFPSALSVAP